MKLSIDSEFYNFVDQNVEKSEDLKKVIEDLSSVNIDEENLINFYEDNLGKAYANPSGFVSYAKDLVNTVNHYFEGYCFEFEASECVRVLIFEALTVFVKKKIENGELNDNNVVLYYLQQSGVELSYNEFQYLSPTGLIDDFQFTKFTYGLKSTLSVISERESGGYEDVSETVEQKEEDVVEEFGEDEMFDDDESEIDGEPVENNKEEEAAASFDELFSE